MTKHMKGALTTLRCFMPSLVKCREPCLWKKKKIEEGEIDKEEEEKERKKNDYKGAQ